MMAARRLRDVIAVLAVAAAPGLTYAQSTERLADIGKLLREARYADAERSARNLLTETEANVGADSLEAARVLDVLVEALWRGAKFRAPETKSLAERAASIKEKQLGSGHADFGFSLATTGLILRLRGDYPAARSTLERALAIQERASGPRSPDVARTLTFLTTLATETGDLEVARAFGERSLAIREEALPAGDPALAESLNALGVVFERLGDSSAARRHHERALAIREKALGPAHPDVAASLNNLGNVQREAGEYAAARSFHERALVVREKAFGPEHPDIAMSLNNLAITVRDLGDHAAAWWLLERVLGIYEKVFGPQHANAALAFHNLATILVDLGDPAGSRLLAERAHRVRAGSDGARFLTESVTRLVGLDPPWNSYRAARALLEHSLAIKEKALGPDHPSVALTLTTLANVITKLGEPDRATPLYERALAIRRKSFGPEHLRVAETLDRLAESRVAAGDYAAARPIYEQVLAITERVNGPDHPEVGVVRQHLAEVLGMMGDVPGSLRMALEAERIGRGHLRLIGRTLPERDALTYAAMRPVGLDVALTLLSRAETRTSVSSAAVWEAVVRSRAVVLDEMASRRRTVGTADRTEAGPLVSDLVSKREQLARLVVRGPEGSGEEYRKDLDRAREARDTAERALAERSAEFRREQNQRQAGLDDVRAALPSGSALIAFVKYVQQPFGVRTTTGGAAPQSVASYLAFVMRKGDAGEPAVVALGSAARLEDAIAKWRRQMASAAIAGDTARARSEAAVREAGAVLRAKIWDPFAPLLTGATRIFIVPEGPLHLVNWDTLPIARARYLIEQAPLLHYVSAERDLVSAERPPRGDGLLIVDSPTFDDRPVLAARRTDPAAVATSLRGARPDCDDLGWMRFDPLPATPIEADTIVKIWRGHQGEALRLSGRAATEAEFKRRAAGTRVLHLATHGFFLGGRCASPLLLAGFALAGANRRQAAGPDEEDGILTAEEVATLDLTGLEWAVLSACDTGVGEVRAGEGVFGLRRAFQVAGARTVIMSLWPVDDDDTRRWMTAVYDRRFARNADTMEAVREASLELLRRRRKAGLSTHPFYWGGFIAAGDWR